MQKLLDNLTKEIRDYYENVGKLDLIPSVTADEIRNHLYTHFDFEHSNKLDDVSAGVQSMLRRWTLHTNHPHYMGLYVPGTMLSSTIADALVSLYNPQLGVWSHAPAACEIERYTLQFFMKKFGMDPETGSANFTTGGTEANLSAVLTALIKSFPEYGDYGLKALDMQPVFYVSEEAHHSFVKIGQITGLGCESVRNVPTDSEFKLEMSELQKLFEQDKKKNLAPFMVAGTAGTTSAGVIDPLMELAAFCKKNQLWFHTDAAYGGAAIMSPNLKERLNGIEQSDSITCDAHKWFSVSMGAGMFFCRHKKHVSEAFHAGAAYLPDTIEDTIDAYRTTIQCSRRFTGLKLFMSLAELGEKGYAELIDNQTRLGQHLLSKLTDAGFEIVNNTPLPVICFTNDKIRDGEYSTTDILNSMYNRKTFWISETKLKNKTPVLRVCITGFRTTENDINDFVKELIEIAGKISRLSVSSK